MNNYKEKQFLKTLNRRHMPNEVTPLLIKSNVVKKEVSSKPDNYHNKVLSSRSLLVNNGTDKKRFFNKQLLKNLRKKQQLTNENSDDKIKSPAKQDSLSLLPPIRKTQKIGYRNIKLLRSFLTDYKKIKSRRLTKLTLKQQRQLSKSVKRARTLKLFDPRKTLKPRKFLNLETKNETINVLLVLQMIKLNKFVELIKSIDVAKSTKLIHCIELIKNFDL